MSHVTLFFFSRTKWWSLLMEGLLSTGPTPSSLDLFIEQRIKDPFTILSCFWILYPMLVETNTWKWFLIKVWFSFSRKECFMFFFVFHQLGPLGRVGLVVKKSVRLCVYALSPSHAIFFEASDHMISLRHFIGPMIKWSVQGFSLVNPPTPPFFFR